MTTDLAAEIIKLAHTQVGVHEGKDKSGWNNIQRYSKEVPTLAWSNGQPWCCTFVSWCAYKSDAAALYPRSASCDAAGAWYKTKGQWSEYPAIGAQIFFGTARDLSHTGLVHAFDEDYVWTIEGNTNSSGAREGDGVYLKKHDRRSARIIGYGYPLFAQGIKSADPRYATGFKSKSPSPAKPAKPVVMNSARVDGVDISHHQSGITVSGIKLAMKSGVKFMYHKCTEGTGFTDVQYNTRRRLANTAGLPYGAYHFARPAKSTGTAQARQYLAKAQLKPGDLVPMLDLEDTGGLGRVALSRWVQDFIYECQRQGFHDGYVYTPFELTATFGWKLWVARYSDAMRAPKIPNPWTEWDIWQFSNGVYGHPDTVPGLGHVDINTVAWQPKTELTRMRIPAPTPKPTPVPPTPIPPVPTPIPPKPSKPTKPSKPEPTGRLVIGTWNMQRDRQPGSVLRELVSLTQATDVDVLMLQECNDYETILTQVPGYRAVAFHTIREQAESMILVKKGRTVIDAHPRQVTYDPDGNGPEIAGWYTHGTAKTPAKHVTVATVEGFTFVSGHTAPSVQSAILRATHRRQWRSYKQFMTNVAKILRISGPRVCMGCDWNVDAKADTGKNLFFPRHILAGVNMVRAFPADGTVGNSNRAIDGFGVRGGHISGVVSHNFKFGSDHRVVTAVLTYSTP